MIKEFKLKYLLRHVAKMYNRECPTHYAGHEVALIRRALIETFDITLNNIIEILQDDIIVTNEEYQLSFKQWRKDCYQQMENDDDPSAQHVLSNINIIWDTILQFQEGINY